MRTTLPAEPPPLRPTQPARAGRRRRRSTRSARAQRPLIIAGRGARESAQAAVAGAAWRAAGRIAGDLGGRPTGCSLGNPWSLGISGGFASPGAAELIGQADVVLAPVRRSTCGRHATPGCSHPRATVIQIDHDPDAIGAHHRVDVAVVGDVAEAARCILARARAPWTRSAPGWRAICHRRADSAAAAWQSTPFDDASTETHIDPRALSADPGSAVAGRADRRHRLRPLHGLSGHVPARARRRRLRLHPGVSGGRPGVGSGIGAAVARPERLTVAALGDGGAMLSLPDLETVARLGLRMLIVVYNDSAYGAEVHHFGPQGHPLDMVQFPRRTSRRSAARSACAAPPSAAWRTCGW